MKALTEVVYAQDSGDHSVVDPPVPIPNTEVKRYSADGSAAIGRVRVGRRQFLPTFLWKVGFFVSTQVAQSCSLRWIVIWWMRNLLARKRSSEAKRCPACCPA